MNLDGLRFRYRVQYLVGWALKCAGFWVGDIGCRWVMAAVWARRVDL